MHFVVFLFCGILLFLSWCRLSLQSCSSSQFECPSTQTCIPMSWVCDYYYDCSDNMDEDGDMTCPFPPANMSTAVIYSVNGGSSHLVSLFGDPDRYGPMFGKPALANSLPLRYTGQLGNMANTFGPITVDYRTHLVYYGNTNQGLIQYGHLLYNNVTSPNGYPALPVTRQIKSLAIDWTTKNMYWIDDEYKFIAVLRADGTIRPPWKVVVGDLSSPKDVVVNPLMGLMFWSDGTGSNANIERSDLSGNNRVVLLDSTQGLVAPTTLVVDFTSQRLYWLDAAASTLGAVNFDGSNVTTWSSTAFSGFSTMTIYGNDIFFGDNTRSRIHVYNKTSVTTFGYKEFSRASGPITCMTMFAADSQPTSLNPCTVDNGNCSQLCLATSSTTRICSCANGLVLSVDGLTCEFNPFNISSKLLFLSDFNQWSIYQLQPETGEIRTVAVKSYPIALTVDTSLNILYFIFKDDSDKKYRIHRRSFDGKIDESIFTASTAISRLTGLALDNARGLLYYTDSSMGVVGELNTNGLQSRIIFQAFEEFPRAIVVDSRNTRLYWTDCSQPPSIQTSRVDGTDRRTLTTGTTGSCFTGLAVDFVKKTMYFSNSTTVETSSLNGSLRTTVYTRYGADFSAITIIHSSLIIADRNQRIPVKYNLSTRTSGAIQLPPSSAIFSSISDVKFFDFEATLTPSPTSSPSSSAPSSLLSSSHLSSPSPDTTWRPSPTSSPSSSSPSMSPSPDTPPRTIVSTKSTQDTSPRTIVSTKSTQGIPSVASFPTVSAAQDTPPRTIVSTKSAQGTSPRTIVSTESTQGIPSVASSPTVSATQATSIVVPSVIVPVVAVLVVVLAVIICRKFRRGNFILHTRLRDENVVETNVDLVDISSSTEPNCNGMILTNGGDARRTDDGGHSHNPTATDHADTNTNDGEIKRSQETIHWHVERENELVAIYEEQLEERSKTAANLAAELETMRERMQHNEHRLQMATETEEKLREMDIIVKWHIERENGLKEKVQTQEYEIAEKSKTEEKLRKELDDHKKFLADLKRIQEKFYQMQAITKATKERQLNEKSRSIAETNDASEQAQYTANAAVSGKQPQDHVSKLARHYGWLSENMLTKRVAAEMFQCDGLTIRELEDIQQCPTEVQATEKLVNILLKQPREIFECFTETLKTTNQDHIYVRIFNEESVEPSNDFAKTIRENYIFLVETMNTKYSDLVSRLCACGMLNTTDKEEIEAEITTTRSNIRLLSLLARRPPEDFELFLDSLDRSGQRHVADKIRGLPTCKFRP